MKTIFERVAEILTVRMKETDEVIEIEVDNDHVRLYATEFSGDFASCAHFLSYSMKLKSRVFRSLEPERADQICILIFKP